MAEAAEPARWLAWLRDATPAVEATRLRLGGLTGPARLLFPLLAVRGRTPLLVVVPRERDVETMTSDLEALCRESTLGGSVLAFPAPGPPVFRRLPRHDDASARRAVALCTAASGGLRALVASPAGLLRPSMAPGLLSTRVVSLAVGEEMTPEILLEALDEGGYRREDPVSAAGQLARRGGIVDLFPPDLPRPVRIEFAGDTVESLREFDPETQRTTRPLDRLVALPLSDLFATRSTLGRLRTVLTERFTDHRGALALAASIDRGFLAPERLELLTTVPGATVAPWTHLDAAVTIILEPEAVREEATALLTRALEDRERLDDPLAPAVEEVLVKPETLAARLAAEPVVEVREVDVDDATPTVGSRAPRRYAGDLRALVGDLRTRREAGGKTVLLLGSAGRAERLADVLREEGLPVGEEEAISTRVLALSTGFELPARGLLVLADGDIFPEEVHLHGRGRRGVRGLLSDFRDLKPGDFVVHEQHGIGRFEGLETLDVGGARHDFMVLSYHGGDRLKVPVDAFDRIQKYSSQEAARPTLDRLGGGRWETVKRRVKKAMRDMAEELLRLYAERKARPGHAFTGHSPWQHEFEEAFEYEETPDQAQAIADVAGDMATPTPMDRLVLGDVGYGKTEVAMRAAMRAVLDGKQVAVLSPTTVLAFQHWTTFRNRFSPFPVTVEMVSRFRPAREVKAVLSRLAQGRVDILVGTHRVLSKDVVFRDLGLLVVDEEQRFGVSAKEKLKQLSRTVDCLTLSATPIPRTLQMGLSGLRDMSVIETPPKDRLAIQTSVVKFDTGVIASAIRHELGRGGQVFLVHHRVESIYALAAMVKRLVPEAQVTVAHGQMPEVELEKAMLAFVEGRADVLVATTIIENGLDIPRANTLIVNRADRYGLGQLYQLRGRVGRSDRKAFAYLLVPPERVLSEIARKRLAAIREFSELGAGFRIAALDLELRGAGNLLGGDQSGHLQAVGLDLYVKLLEQTILEMRGETPRQAIRASLNLGLDLRLPESYVPDVNQRMALYKRVSQLRSPPEVEALQAELLDRYGPLPPQAETLLGSAILRVRMERLGIESVDVASGTLRLRLTSATPLTAQAAVALTQSLRGASLVADGFRVATQAGELPRIALETVLDRLERVVSTAPGL